MPVDINLEVKFVNKKCHHKRTPKVLEDVNLLYPK